MTRSHRLAWKHTRVLAAVLLAAGTAYAVPAVVSASAATPLTVVTIQFDDGNADVFQWLSPLNNHGLA